MLSHSHNVYVLDAFILFSCSCIILNYMLNEKLIFLTNLKKKNTLCKMKPTIKCPRKNDQHLEYSVFCGGRVYRIHTRNDLIHGVGYNGNVNANIGWNCVKRYQQIAYIFKSGRC